MSCEGEFPPKGWEFSEWQKPVWNSTLSLEKPAMIWINAGRGAGKDIVCIRCAIRDALKLYQQKLEERARGELRAVVNPLVKGWLVGPSENNLTQLKIDFQEHLRGMEEEWELEENTLFRWVERRRTFYLFGENQIEFECRLSSVKDAMRGPGVDIVIFTEFASEQRREAFEAELQGTVSRAGRLGRLYLNSTPKGPKGLFHERCKPFLEDQAGQEPKAKRNLDESGLEAYFHATAYDNDFLTDLNRARIEAEQKLGWIYEQERLGRFVIPEAGEDGVFSPVSLSKCWIKPKARPGVTKVRCGVDPAEEGTERTAFVIVDVPTLKVPHLKVINTTKGPEIIDQMEAFAGIYPGIEFVLDGTGQRYLKGFIEERERQKKIRLPVRVVNYREGNKAQQVKALRYLFDKGELGIPQWGECSWMSKEEEEAFKLMQSELFQYRRTISARGVVKYCHPPGGTDDTVTGLLLALDDVLATITPQDAQETRDMIGELL